MLLMICERLFAHEDEPKNPKDRQNSPLCGSGGARPAACRQERQGQNRALKLPLVVWEDGRVVEKPA